MTKEEIYKLICDWIDSGYLIQKSSCVDKENGGYYAVWKGVEDGGLFFTGNDRIVAKDRGIRDQFQAFLDQGRVMNLAGVTIRHPECTTAHSISKLVKQGDLLMIDKLSSVTLYVE